MADALSNLVATAVLTLAMPHGRDQITAAQLCCFVCDSGIWIARSSNFSANDATISLSRVTRAGALEQVRELFKPVGPRTVAPAVASGLPPVASPEPRCPACREPVTPGARFCDRCGADMSVRRAPACPRCGTEVGKPGAKFCIACGAALISPAQSSGPAPEEPIPVLEETHERRCPNPRCGQWMDADKKFCTSCGTRMPREE
jgi:hypothetical protein